MDISRTYDVIVVGGGISGTMAAISAAREAAHTLLVERYSALGGMGTLGLVQPITTWGLGKNYVVGGTGRRILEELAQSHPYAATGMTTYGPSCDSEYLKWCLECRAVDAGVDLLYHSWVRDVTTAQDGRITSLVALTKAGDVVLKGKTIIHASGDADVAAFAGVPFDVGSQGITLMFLVAGIDRQRCGKRNEISRVYGERRVGYRGLALFWHARPDAAYFNVTEVENHNALDPVDLTRATVDCRRQAWQILEIMRKHAPGFEEAYIAETAPALGVRETRRIKGLFTLGLDDVKRGGSFPDAIARAGCPVDVHGSADNGKGDYWGLSASYAIPYRSLIAAETPNLIVTGRPISADHAAHSSLRRMAPGFALGEAAGVAAALTGEGDVRELDTGALRETLRQYGAILDPEDEIPSG